MDFRYKGIDRFLATCTVVVIALFFTACDDDLGKQYRASSAVTFKVDVPNGWSRGMNIDESNSGSRCTAVEELSSDGDTPLYLHIIESENQATDCSKIASRGTLIDKKDDFASRYKRFSLSAVCYSGTYDDDNESWAPSYLYNSKYNISDGSSIDGLQLYWPLSGHVRFFGFAPVAEDSESTIVLSSADDTGSPRITYTVPTVVENQFDLMTCCTVASSPDVKLEFQHALTAVRLKCGDDMLSGKITEVSISGIYGKGTHIPGSKTWTPDETSLSSYTISADIDLPSKNEKDPSAADKIHAPADTPITGTADDNLTFMLIPQILPSEAKITICFKDDVTGNDRKIEGSIAGSKWEAGKIVTYVISSSSIHVSAKAEFSKDPDTDIMPYSGVWYDATLKTYVEVTQGTDISTIEVEPTRIEYNFGTGSDWQSDYAQWIADENIFTIPAQAGYTSLRNAFTSSATDIDVNNCIDLSTEKNETANCYMVDKAGYYCFPLVYGNALKNGEYNEKAYTPTATDGIKYFANHNDAEISSPYIANCHSAVLVWQDAPDLVDDVKIKDGKLYFRVRELTLNQGNAVLAVRASDKTILWSWHIWVTPYKNDWYTKYHETKSAIVDRVTYKLATCNLGYCDPHAITDNERKFKLRAVVDLSEYGLEKEQKIDICEGKEFIQMEFKGSMAGDNTYYQWGRKDPMLPGIYNAKTPIYGYHKRGVTTSTPDTEEFTMENKQFFNAYKDDDGLDYSFRRNPTDQLQRGTTIGYTIKNPYIMVMSSLEIGTDKELNLSYNHRNHWHRFSPATPYMDYEGFVTLYNTWNSGATKTAVGNNFNEANAQHVTKTIYDPCPPGYKIPPADAFTAFACAEPDAYAKYGGYSDAARKVVISYDGVRWLIKYEGGSKEIVFPATGMRNMALRTNEWSTIVGKDSEWRSNFYEMTMPAFRRVTYLTTASSALSGTAGSYYEELIYYIDDRHDNRLKDSEGNPIGEYSPATHSCLPSNNSYGMSLRPIRDE